MVWILSFVSLLTSGLEITLLAECPLDRGKINFSLSIAKYSKSLPKNYMTILKKIQQSGGLIEVDSLFFNS
jgi:hypothetical protein